MFAAKTAGYQAAPKVPTEILAEQHFESLQNLFPIWNWLLTGSFRKLQKERSGDHHKGEADLIIGTHARYKMGWSMLVLAWIIIDEQHRFGVGQRRIYGKKLDVLDDGDSHSTDACHHSLRVDTIIDRCQVGAYRRADQTWAPLVVLIIRGEIQKVPKLHVISLTEESEV